MARRVCYRTCPTGVLEIPKINNIYCQTSKVNAQLKYLRLKF